MYLKRRGGATQICRVSYRWYDRILEVPKLLDHIQATGVVKDSSRMTGVNGCRGSWRHFGSAGMLKIGAA